MNLHKYSSHAEYVATQVRANKRKLNTVYVDAEAIPALVETLLKFVPSVCFGICHGTRRGVEQECFIQALSARGQKAEVIGTELSPTATSFSHTIQWDFHDVKPEWIGAVDFIYSNSLDHSYDPELCLSRWMSCLSDGGLCIIEWDKAHGGGSVSDPFSATIDEFREFVSNSHDLVEEVIVPGNKKRGDSHFVLLKTVRKEGADGSA
ncbi:MAG TPA: hypothetical protein ENH11_08805 [Candidatus Acetothermia bacterium]|nr:hypothetical protein [Candidatus Acetothermia bacterium]